MPPSNVAIEHFESLPRVLNDLSQDRIELLEHRFEALAFGSFEVVLGRAHRRLKFTWDGRDALLSVSFVDFSNKSTSAAWTHDADFSLPNGVGLYAEIASQSTDLLAI